MVNLIKAKVKLDEIIVDPEIYPRSTHFWQTAFIYSEAMKAGAKFPPIVVAMFNGKKYLIDGKHRMEALKLLKKDSIPAEVRTGWNKAKMFEESIRLNIAHGLTLSSYDKARIAVKLRAMNYGPAKISALIQVPQAKLEGFLAQRLISSTTGQVIHEVAVKSGLKDQNKVYSEAEVISLDTKQIGVNTSQERLIEQFGYYLGENLFNLDDPKISGGLVDIRDALSKLDIQ